MMSFLTRLDRRLFLLLNGMGRERLDPVFGDLSSLGGWTLGLVAVAALAADSRRLFLRHLLVLLAALAVLTPVNHGLKDWVGRSRPARVFSTEVEEGKVRIVGDRVTRRSFPSGHSLFAFFLMTYVGMWRKTYRAAALSLAFLIAFSRVYVGAHFPFDCLAGATIGAAGGWLAWQVFRRAGGEPESTA